MLVELMKNGEFDVKKEAAWAISNATYGGSPSQVKYLVQCGCIQPLCMLLDAQDVKIIEVSLDGLEQILMVSFLSIYPLCFSFCASPICAGIPETVTSDSET